MADGKYISFSIEGEKQLSRRLLILSNDVKDWTPAFSQTATELKDLFSGPVFDTQGGAINEKWAPLSKAYALEKAKKFPGKGILVATGAMKNSFKSLFRSDMAAIWNDADYFKYHQSKAPRKSHLPRRIMMKLGQKQREIVVKIFQKHFRTIINKKT